MERKIQRIARQRRNRSWVLRSIIIAQLVVVMMLAGVGAAFAITQNPIGNTTPWAGTASITQSTHFSVASGNYSLTYNGALTEVVGVTVDLTAATGANTATVKAAILNGAAVVAIGSVSGTYIPGTTTPVPITLNASVALANLGTFNILVTEP